MKNLEALNKVTGKNNTLRDVKELLNSDKTTDIHREIASDIARECRAQEMTRESQDLI